MKRIAASNFQKYMRNETNKGQRKFQNDENEQRKRAANSPLKPLELQTALKIY